MRGGRIGVSMPGSKVSGGRKISSEAIHSHIACVLCVVVASAMSAVIVEELATLLVLVLTLVLVASSAEASLLRESIILFTPSTDMRWNRRTTNFIHQCRIVGEAPVQSHTTFCKIAFCCGSCRVDSSGLYPFSGPRFSSVQVNVRSVSSCPI